MQSNLNYFGALGILFESASTSLQCSMGECGINLLKAFEGCILSPYQCPAGVWTIGYGHAFRTDLAFDYSMKITEAQALQLLYRDANLHHAAALRLTPVTLAPHQQDAIGCFIFNLGSGAYQRSTLRRAILRGDDAAIQHEWMRWVWAGGRKLPGLVRRRVAELELFYKN